MPTPKNTRAQREKELRAIVAEPGGREKIHKIVMACVNEGSTLPMGGQAIQFILDHEYGGQAKDG